MSFERRSFAGAAAVVTLSTNINSSDTSIVLSAATNWPTGSAGDFFIVIDPAGAGGGSEEKIRIASRTTTTLTVASSGRGADGTSASSHNAGVTIYLVGTAVDFDEANNAVHQTVGLVAAKGDLLVGSAANTLVKKAVGTNDQFVVADSTAAGGLKWSAIPSGAISSSGMFASGVVTSAAIADATIVDGDVAATNKDGATGTASMRTLGTGAQQAAAGNDSRLSDTRTPAAASITQAMFTTGYRGAFVGTSAPSSPTAGDFWYDTTNKLVMVYNGSSWSCITPKSTTVATVETTSSTTYADLATSGPAVTMTTGTSVIVIVSSLLANTQLDSAFASVAVSGATTTAAVDTHAARFDSAAANQAAQGSWASPLTVTAGSNTFTMKYRVGSGGGTGTFANRAITVIGLP